MLDLDYDITGLRGADYNPRKINEADLQRLGQSIAQLGMVKPLIVRGDLLVAGHQRTKALRAIGVTRAPVYLLPVATTIYDEVRFNQLHNGTDMDCGDENASITGGFGELGYTVVEPGRVTGNFRGKMANVRAMIGQLIAKYGSWGGCVATKSGRIIHCAQYAISAAMSRVPLTVYVVDDARANEYAAFLNSQYGVFSYDNLPRETYIQTFAQMLRLRAGPSGKENRSTLYENHVIPWLKAHPQARVLDFGSGQGDYAKRLRLQGYALDDLELFRRAAGKNAIDVSAVNRMITKALVQVAAGGYDAVVCDSVFNSVDCREAESAVITLCNAFAKVGGAVFYSGRKMERLAQLDKMTSTDGQCRYVEFLDDDGFTALYRKGRWFYQKFHDANQAAGLAKDAALQVVSHVRTKSSTSWQIHSEKIADLPFDRVRSAVEYEFNLPVSKTRRLNRHKDAIAAFEKGTKRDALAA